MGWLGSAGWFTFGFLPLRDLTRLTHPCWWWPVVRSVTWMVDWSTYPCSCSLYICLELLTAMEGGLPKKAYQEAAFQDTVAASPFWSGFLSPRMSVFLHIIGQRKVNKARLSVKGREISLYSMMGEWQSSAAEKKNVEWEILLWVPVENTLVITFINLIHKLFYTYE